MIKTSSNLYEVLYVSSLAPDAPLSVIADIAGKARLHNAKHDITGLLIFDGLRFCQQLEGPQKPVLALIERIRTDPRHTEVEIFHHGPLATRRFRSFALGFTNVDDVDVLGRISLLDGQPGIDAFTELVTTIDLDV